MYTVHGRGADRSPFLYAFRPRSNIGTDKSAA